MGKELKTLVKDTAIYGLSSIVGRFLNYLLVPLHTTKIIAESGGYGVVSNVYAYTALLMALLTFGMETTFFRFSNKEGEDERKVYGTTLWMVGGVSLLFALLCFVFNAPISAFMGYADPMFNQDQCIWNASVSQTFLKNKALTLQLEGVDLLRQRTAEMSSANATSRTYTRTRAYLSYVMLHAVYKFKL